MELKEKMKKIEEHFKNITDEDFETNLTKSGHGFIQHSAKSGYKLKSPEQKITKKERRGD